MKVLFLGHFAATVAPQILAKVQTSLESSILDDDGDAAQLGPLLADTEIVVGHIWRAAFPPAPRLRLLQSVAAGLDLLDTGAVPKGVTICNVFGHEPAIAAARSEVKDADAHAEAPARAELDPTPRPSVSSLKAAQSHPGSFGERPRRRSKGIENV